MARPSTRASEAKSEPGKTTDLFLYWGVKAEWQCPVAGSQPLRPTLPDHLIRILEQEESRTKKQAAKQPAVEGIVEAINGEPLLAEGDRKAILREVSDDPLLDEAAKQVLEEVLSVPTPGQILIRTIGRSTTTFPRNKEGFFVPDIWWMGAMKVALRNLRNMYTDQAREVVKRCFSVYPKELSLGADAPTEVREVNVQLDTVSPQQAKASIKRVHIVTPANTQFTLVIKALNGASPAIKELIEHMENLWKAMGEAGVGGLRPQYGRFKVISCARISAEEAEASGLLR